MSSVAQSMQRTGLLSSLVGLYERVVRALAPLADVLDLVLRIWVGKVFFMSGLVKIASWSATIGLFENEYHVPLLPPNVAAVMGTAAELGLPVFLVLGLGGRFAAAAMFVFNIIAVISYPDLSEVGLKDHYYWGIMLLVTLLHGPGRISVDWLVGRWLGRPAAR